MSDGGLLLRAKLLPPRLGQFHLRRPRLHERLDAAQDGRATLITGGAGTGKTSLAVSYLQEQQLDFVWYRLDATDRDPAWFFEYLIEGIRRHAPGFGASSAGLRGQPGQGDSETERLVDVLIRDAEESLDTRLVVVLDGVEALEPNPASVRVLRRMLAYLPDTLHLMLVGRSLPEIGAQSLVADGAAAIVHADELLFDEDETGRLLLDVFGLPLSADSVRQVHERTRGWVTALQFLRRVTDSERAAELGRLALDRSESDVFSYFGEQVFAAEPAEIRDFLMRTSLPSVLDPEVIDRALGTREAAAILGRLVERHVFVSSLKSQNALYAYDPLFRGFLADKLKREGGRTEVLRTHLAFGRAMADLGDSSGALEHLLAAEAAPELTQLLGRDGRRMLQAGLLLRVRQAAQAARDLGGGAAVLDDVQGEACRLAGDYAAAVGHFERALDRDAAQTSLNASARAAALQGLAYSLLQLREMDRAADTAEQGLAAAGDDDPALVARILNTLSIVRYRENDIQAAIDGWNDALTRARKAGDEQLTLMIAHNLGLPYAVSGDFRRASDCFRILTAAENRRLGPQEGAAYLNLARIATLRGEFELAASLLDNAREIGKKWNLRALAGDTSEAEANLLRDSGALEAASKKYAEAREIFTELALTEALDSVAEEEAILSAESGDVELADRLSFEVERRARTSGTPERMACALAARGAVHASRGDAQIAANALTDASARFEALGHAYQEAVCRLRLAVALARTGDWDGALRSAEQALELAARYEYRHAVLKILGVEQELLRRVSALPLAAELGLDAAPDTAAPIQLGDERADLAVLLLGPIEVYQDGKRIPAGAWKLKRALRVFCCLLTSRNYRTTKDRLVDAVWADATLSAVKKNFHPTISFLRRALNHERHVSKNFILHESGAYLLNPAYRYDLDIIAFERGVRSARAQASAGEIEAAQRQFDQALELYRGPLLEEIDDAWIEAPRTHYDMLYRAALQEAGEIHRKAGNVGRATGLLHRLVELNPLDEAASCLLMAVLGEQGHVGDVEEEFHRLSRMLDESLSLAPGAETRKVYDSALGKKGR